MNENELLAHVAAGESSAIDFKLRLSLDTARNRAELIKDVLSIANSNPSGGYLFVGVDDNGHLTGIDSVQEERIQQICHTYITPPVVLECDMVPVSSAGFVQIGVISVKPTSRPHKVARAIERLSQNDVFVRRGSTTAKASPEEIIQMHEDSAVSSREVRQYVRSAEIHLRLENYEAAIAAYSKAVEISPSAELFWARAQGFCQLRTTQKDKAWWQSSEAALKDLADAIELAESEDLASKAKTLRRNIGRGFAFDNYTSQQKAEDFEHEKSKLSGEKLGEWIYNQVLEWDPHVKADAYTVSLLEEAIGTGYSNPELHFLHARALYGARNYGLALEAIDSLVQATTEGSGARVKYQCFRASILVELGQFSEAREALIEAREMDSVAFKDSIDLGVRDFEEEMALRYALSCEFTNRKPHPQDLARIAILARGREVTVLTTSLDGERILECRTVLDGLGTQHPGLLNSVRAAVSSEDWAALKRGRPAISVNRSFPSVPEIISTIKDRCYSWVHDDKLHYFPFVTKRQ